MKQLIFAIVTAILAIVFALQNATSVTVKLFFWDFSMSLALLIVVLIGLGLVTGLLVMYPKVYSKNSQVKSLQKQVQQTESTVKK